MKKYIILSVLFAFSLNAIANKTSSEIYKELQKLQSFKRVLYIAAHPDDENTRALAWFSLKENAATAYFSLTRGDGGQNLIGKELGEDLGVLRTYELLSARSYDGAQQFFSRAVDFGYSKSAEESLQKWNRDSILSDAVLMVRMFKPDVIITRFPPDERAGHGHHIASALIAIEAFTKAADPDFLPDQVKQYGTWQATSIYWNTSFWAQKDVDKVAENNPDYLTINMGTYDPVLGKSYNEIGTIARSQHKCQGFGAIIERGPNVEYFKYLAGKKLQQSFFENNQQSWQNLLGGDFEKTMTDLLQYFDFQYPENNVAALQKIKEKLQTLPASFFKDEKINLCNKIIMDCLGLYVEAVTTDYAFAPKDTITYTLRIINRSDKPVSYNSKNIPAHTLTEDKVTVTAGSEISNPYWLKAPFKDLYVVKDRKNLLKPVAGAAYQQKITFTLNDEPFETIVPVEYVWRDPADGEKRRSVITSPAYTVNFDKNNIILKHGGETEIKLEIHNFKNTANDTVTLTAPQGWQLTPAVFPVHFDKKHQELFFSVKIKVSGNAPTGNLVCLNSSKDTLYSKTEIAYRHIPAQTIFKPAKILCIKLNAEIKKGKVAYLNGAEDMVPQAITQLGFEVQTFEVADLAQIDLTGFESVVLGIRIYNVHPELHNFDDKLFSYVQAGGNLVIQYNTASRFSGDENRMMGVLPFRLTSKRVTEEDAAVTFLEPQHELLNHPNKITEKDFENWVQERGLYFAGEWDSAYHPLLSWHDKGEEAQTGALICADYGKGRVIYTGISFFRELPAGIEGAYRLFANLLSYEHR